MRRTAEENLKFTGEERINRVWLDDEEVTNRCCAIDTDSDPPTVTLFRYDDKGEPIPNASNDAFVTETLSGIVMVEWGGDGWKSTYRRNAANATA